MIINQIFLALFFLYFVLMSVECSEIMNCGLQRYISNNNWTKHVMIFISIYIFTFILNWYTIESLVIEKFENNTNKNINKNNKISYLTKSFYHSIIIYLIFILSTKNEGPYLFIFIISSILIVIVTIYTKSINNEIYSEFTNNFIIFNKKKQQILQKYNTQKNDINKIVLIQNIISITSIIIFLLLFIGSYQYYLKQSKDHKYWSWLIFWFGYNKQCK